MYKVSISTLKSTSLQRCSKIIFVLTRNEYIYNHFNRNIMNTIPCLISTSKQFFCPLIEDTCPCFFKNRLLQKRKKRNLSISVQFPVNYSENYIVFSENCIVFNIWNVSSYPIMPTDTGAVQMRIMKGALRLTLSLSAVFWAGNHNVRKHAHSSIPSIFFYNNNAYYKLRRAVLNCG